MPAQHSTLRFKSELLKSYNIYLLSRVKQRYSASIFYLTKSLEFAIFKIKQIARNYSIRGFSRFVKRHC